MDGNHCLKCGRCCTDWLAGPGMNPCEHLEADLVTCKVYEDKSICGGLQDNWPDLNHASNLPPGCGYVTYWREQGII